MNPVIERTDYLEQAKPEAVKTKRRMNGEIFWGYLFILPTIGAFILFSLIPTISVFALSLFKWDMINNPVYIGFQNYADMFANKDFWHVLSVTLTYMFYSQVPKIIIALLVALLLVKTLPGIKVFQIPMVLPWIAMPIAVAMVWKWILDPMSGLLNYYLGILGIERILWFSPDTVLQSIAIVDVWQHFGFTTILFMVGLQNISAMYYEAASIDGANRFRQFWHITLPLLKPTLLFIMVTSIIGSFQVFDVIYATTQGGPGDLSRVYYFLIYDNAFKNLQMGYASALSVFLFVVLMLLTMIQMKVFKDKTTY